MFYRACGKKDIIKQRLAASSVTHLHIQNHTCGIMFLWGIGHQHPARIHSRIPGAYLRNWWRNLSNKVYEQAEL